MKYFDNLSKSLSLKSLKTEIEIFLESTVGAFQDLSTKSPMDCKYRPFE